MAAPARTMLVEVGIVGEIYTHSMWCVRPGLEDEFVRRWEELADWSGLQGLAARAKLLRDTDDPCRFVTFMASSQVGKTSLGNIFTLGSLVMDNGTVLVCHPTEDNARRWSKKKKVAA